MPRFTVTIPPESFTRLKRLSELERRAVRDQAAVLLERAVRRVDVASELVTVPCNQPLENASR